MVARADAIFKAVVSGWARICVVTNLAADTINAFVTVRAVIEVSATTVGLAFLAANSTVAVLTVWAVIVVGTTLAAESVDADIIIRAVSVVITTE